MKLRGQDNLENGIEYIVLPNDIYNYLSAIICDKDDLSGGVVAPVSESLVHQVQDGAFCLFRDKSYSYQASSTSSSYAYIRTLTAMT